MFISKNTSPFFINESHISKSEGLHVKHGRTLSPPLPKPSFAILRIKNSKLCHHPFATLSSFAESEGEENQQEGIQLDGHHHQQQQNAQANKTKDKEGDGDDELPCFAQAFNISPSTAFAISTCLALAALTFPFFMSSLGQGLALRTKLLSYATLLFGFYMAWNIGANDVANAMGTSVGSGALTLRQAVLTAAVLEFSGALLMGTHVTSTMQKGLLVADAFQGKDNLLFAGLLSSLAAAGTWLQVTNYIDLVLYPIKRGIFRVSLTLNLVDEIGSFPVRLHKQKTCQELE